MNSPMEDPVVREYIKGATAVVVASTGVAAPVAAAVCSAVGVSLEYLGSLGEKRTEELFDSKDLVLAVESKIRNSDDFASYVFSIWQKHNLESSKRRREMLKNFLEKEVRKGKNIFENFSQIEYIIQTISFYELDLLNRFYDHCTELDKINAKQDIQNLNTGKTAQLDMQHIFESLKLPTQSPVESSRAINAINQLANKGLINLEYRGDGRDGSPWYATNSLGKLFLEYISDTDAK